jgi:glycosyltransferase involved in cell wall biosynthesis
MPTDGPAMRLSVVVPAYREAGRVGETVQAIRAALADEWPDFELLVVDDGSPDGTAAEAEAAGATVLRLTQNVGKGAALARGLAKARGDLLAMLDADLGVSAADVTLLLEPVVAGEADMSVAVFPSTPGHRGGFGFVLRAARWGLRRAGAPPMQAPLSGQRVFTRAAWERIGRLDDGFALEMGLNLDAAHAGLRVVEVPTTMRHRLTGRNLAGFRHRGRQFAAVLRALARRGLLTPFSQARDSRKTGR